MQQVPDLINGFKLYVVDTTLEDYSDDTADLQYFDTKTSNKIKYAGIRKGGICQGSWECPNPHCIFKALSVNNQPNRVSWLNVKGYKNLKICDSCSQEAGVWCQEICQLQSSDKHCPCLPHGHTHMHPPNLRQEEKRSAWPKYFKM